MNVKSAVAICVFSIFSTSFSVAQETEEIFAVNSGRSMDMPEYSFYIKGEKSDIFLDNMFKKYPKTKDKGYILKFKNITVDGINSNMNLKIHKGIHGDKENGGGYFITFKNDGDRSERIKNISDNQILGIIIYVMKGKNEFIETKEEADKFISFVLSMSNE